MFDINAAIAKTNIAGSKSKGSCAKYVRTYIEAGGLKTVGHPVSAYLYGGFLPKIGFSKIASVKGKQNQAMWTTGNAKPGDIAVMKHGQHGHICMWTGNCWVSDFRQNRMSPYQDEGICDIFRYGA